MTEQLGVILFFVVAAAAAWFGTHWLMARGAAERRREAEKLERVSALSLQEATTRARALLSEPAIFRTVASSSRDEVALEQLAPEVRRILREYESIECLKEPRAKLRRSAIGPSEHRAGFVRIGLVAEASDAEAEVVVRPGEETVYELIPGEAPDPEFGTFKSVYHWLLVVAQQGQ